MRALFSCGVLLPAPFSKQLLDLIHRWWSEAEGLKSESTISLSLRPRLTLALNCTLPGIVSQPHFSFQTPGSQPAPSPTFSQLSLLFSTGVSLTTFRLCTQPGQSAKLLPKNIASVGDLHTGRLGKTLRGTLLLEVLQFRQRSPQVTCTLLSRVLSGVLASGANDYVGNRPPPWTPRQVASGSSAWFFSCVIWGCLLQAGGH